MITWFARHPTAANILMAALVVIGIMALPLLERETFPEFAANKVEISVVYPGATPEEIEEAICAPIEEAVEGIEYRRETVAEAQEGIARVTVEMEDAGDLSTFLSDINAEVDAIDQFPELAEEPVIRLLGRTNKVVSVAVQAPLSGVGLKNLCEDIRDRLQVVPGVSKVELRGFSDHQVMIELSLPLLYGYGLTVQDVAAAIRSQSFDRPLGTLETHRQDILIRMQERRRLPREFLDIPIKAANSGAEIRLGEVATIAEDFEDRASYVTFNGERAGILEVHKSQSEDALRVLENVKSFLAREKPNHPDTVRLELTEDSTSIVADRLNMLVVNGIQGLILVFLAMWLFFNWRYSFWVAMGLPVSFLGAFYFMSAFGQSINMITMVGMLLALGLLMDDAIVIAENIAAHRGRGAGPMQAAIRGVSEVKVGVFSSFATTVCVFGPLIFLEGQIGKVLLVMPIVLIIILSVSLIEAFFILPHHLGHALAREKPGSRHPLRRWINERFDLAREKILGRAVDYLLGCKGIFLASLIAVFFITVAMMASNRLPIQPFPDIEGDIATVRLLMPQGTPQERMEDVVAHIKSCLDEVCEELQDEQPDGRSLVRNLTIQYGVNSEAGEGGAHVATINVDLLQAEIRGSSIDDVLGRWREKAGRPADVISLTFTEPFFGPAGRPFEARLSASSLEHALEASRALSRELSSYKGVVDLAVDLRPGKPELRITMKEGADVLGITAEAVAAQIRSAIHGSVVDEIQTAHGNIEIQVQAQEEFRDSTEDLEHLYIRSSRGDLVPLGIVADVRYGRGYSRIKRVDGQRCVTLTGDLHVKYNTSAAILADLNKGWLDQFSKRYPDVQLEWQGEKSEGTATKDSLLRALIIGLVGIYFILSFQFRSWIDPVVVLFAIPFAFIGVIWGHFAMGLPMTMPSIMGFVSLAGVVVNDSILLIEFLKMRIKEGMSVTEAARRASRERFRAVLLTSLTTVVGLLPLLFEKSPQAQTLVPLAAAIVFGLAASTFMVLTAIPVLFALLNDIGFLKSEIQMARREEG